MSDFILYERRRQTAILTLNRPDKRNALSAALVTALREALREVADDEAVRAVVLTGAGRAFSAGADLAALEALQAATPMENEDDSAHLAGLFKEVYLHPKPIIAKVNGPAIGGGAGLAAACDFSIATEDAKIGFAEVRLGFVPAIVMVFVLRKLGEAAAKDLLLRGAVRPAREMAALGLITRAVPPGDLGAAVDELAAELARETSGTAVALTKRMMAQLPGMGLSEALAYAAQVNAFARGTADCQAGISAFLNKTDAPWRRKAETGRSQTNMNRP